jgi:hypothetical protein
MKAKKTTKRNFGNDFDDAMPKSTTRKESSKERKASRKPSIYDDFEDDESLSFNKEWEKDPDENY